MARKLEIVRYSRRFGTEPADARDQTALGFVKQPAWTAIELRLRP